MLKNILIFLVLFLFACQKNKWINTNLFQKETPLLFEIKGEKAKIYDYTFQAKHYSFSTQKDKWLFDDQSQISIFSILEKKKDSIFLINGYGTKFTMVDFDKTYKYKKRLRKSLKNRTFAGQEKHIFNLLQALQAPNVEQRIRQIIQEFHTGDYLLQETIFLLMGVNPKPDEKEREDLEQQRNILKNIFRIFKGNTNFQIELEKMQDLEISLPIFQDKSPNAKPVMVLDLSIKTGAKATIKDLGNALQIDIDGVKIGKSWLKVGIPPLLIKSNTGHILGFSFPINR